MNLKRQIRVARGEEPADLVIKRARLVNVFSEEIYETDIAVDEGLVAGLGAYDGRETFDAAGAFAVPGFIDAHIHLESSCLTPSEFARAVVPTGTTAVVADPHEIVNVLGAAGLTYMLDASRGLPLAIRFMLPSCVPVTELETSGARFEAADLAAFMNDSRVAGLAEVMNVPDVLDADPAMLAKLSAAAGKIIDGHAPALSGRDLCAYIGAGMRSDHECVTAGEAAEKVRLGMRVLIREGSVAKNLESLLPAVTASTAAHFALVSDDRHPTDLLAEGHVNALLTKAVALGLSPLMAIRMVTLNPAGFYSLPRLGAIAPGYQADIALLKDLRRFQAIAVFKEGRHVAQEGKLLGDLPAPPSAPRSRMKIAWERIRGFGIPVPGPGPVIGRIIDLVPGELITREVRLPLTVRDGEVVSDPGRDLVKLGVVERHKGTGNVGLGFVRGLGLRQGAIASSVAHDSHNIVVVGVDDADMMAAVRAIERMEGGIVVVRDGAVLASIPLPIGGLLSDLPLERVAAQMADVFLAARLLGSPLPDPFMSLSFLALPVIPSLKLTDFGLVDVARGELVPLFIDR